MSISYLSTEFREYRNHHDNLRPKYTADLEMVVDSYEEYQQLVEYVQKFNNRNCTVETPEQPTVTINPSVDPQNLAEIFKQTLLQATDDRQVPLFKPEHIVTYAPVQAAAVVAPPTVPEPTLVQPVAQVVGVPPAKVEVSPEVESPKLVNDVLFLFEEDCKKIKDMASAIKVWKDHAGAIKKLGDTDKLRGSNTLALRLAEVLNVEPEEAKELFRAAMANKKSEPAKQEPVAEAPKTVEAAPVLAKPLLSDDTAEDARKVLEALSKEPKPVLGLAVKHACTQLKTEQGVSAKMVEDLLVSLIGKHPTLNVTPEEIYKITRQSAMKLYAGAAKTKLLDK